MTASIENARQCFALLKKGLDEAGCPRLADFADSAGKCVESLAGQVAFYEGQKAREAAPGDNTAAAVLRSPRFSGSLTVYGDADTLDRLKIILMKEGKDLWLY